MGVCVCERGKERESERERERERERKRRIERKNECLSPIVFRVLHSFYVTNDRVRGGRLNTGVFTS